MKRNIIYVVLDIDDTHYQGSALINFVLIPLLSKSTK